MIQNLLISLLYHHINLSLDFPMNLLSNKLKQLANQLLKKCPETILSVFFEDCIDNMLKNIRNSMFNV